MTDEGNHDADLWANTSPQPATPTTSATGATDPTQVQPVTPTPMTPSGFLSVDGRPRWGGPATIGLVGGGIIAAIVILLLTRGGNDSVQTVDESTTTVFIDTTMPVATTIVPATTVLAQATIPPAEPTFDPTTTEATDTAPATAPAPAPATATAPTATSTVPLLASPGTVRVDGVEYRIERSCFTVPLAPDYAELQVFSHLISIDGTSAIVQQWFDEGAITGGAFSVRGFPADTGEFLELDQGYAFEAPAGSGDFSIVANPTSTGSDCANEQGIQTYGANDKPRYLRALVDACFISNDAGESTLIGYGSDLGRVEIRGDADGNFFMTYFNPAVLLDGASTELLGDGGSFSYRAQLAEGSVLVTTEDSLLRDCTNADLG